MSGPILGALIGLWAAVQGVALTLLYYWIYTSLSDPAGPFVGFVAAAAALLAACGTVAGIGFWLEARAMKKLPLDPVGAASGLQWWALFPAALAGFAAAVAAIASAMLGGLQIAGVPTGSATEAGKALGAAITAFLGAVIIKAASDADTEWIAPRIKTRFRERYAAKQGGPEGVGADGIFNYDPDKGGVRTALDEALYSAVIGDELGWGREARSARAEAIRKAIDVIESKNAPPTA